MKAVGEEMRLSPPFSTKINEPLEVFGVELITDSAIVIKARFKTKPMQQWDVGNEYRKRLRGVLDKQGVEIPCPRHMLVFANNAIPAASLVRGESELTPPPTYNPN
jgi:small conductance mechanosensitive channel